MISLPRKVLAKNLRFCALQMSRDAAWVVGATDADPVFRNFHHRDTQELVTDEFLGSLLKALRKKLHCFPPFAL
jgi:hypothetical protein